MILKKRPLIALALLVLLLLAACAQAVPTAAPAAAPRQSLANEGKTSSSTAPYAVSQDSASPAGGATGSGSAAIDAPEPRMLIRNGTLSIVVADTDGAVDKIKTIAQDLQGLCDQLELLARWRATARADDSARARRILRPGHGADQGHRYQGGKGEHLRPGRDRGLYRSAIAAENPAGHRVRAAEAADAGARAFQQGRGYPGRLSRADLIQSQIEQVKGRMQYYERLTDMSTINIELTPDALAKPIIVAGWRPGETVKQCAAQLGQGAAMVRGCPDRDRALYHPCPARLGDSADHPDPDREEARQAQTQEHQVEQTLVCSSRSILAK